MHPLPAFDDQPGPMTLAPPPQLSVVIAAHDAAATLEDQLDALCAQDWERPWEIVVVDNGSTDATPAIVERAAAHCPRLRLVAATDGRGPAYARNVGARAAAGTLLAFCDADDVVGPGWVAAMGDALAEHDFVCGPVELARLNPSWLVGSRGSTGTDAVAWFEDRFPFASSCNLGIRRDRFDAVSGFDESLHVGEDIDLSMRLHLEGVRLAFCRGALIHYRYRPTLWSTFDRGVAYGAAGPVIAERWRERGGTPVAGRRSARGWAWLVRHIMLLRRRDGRARWLWVAGQRIGRIAGSVRVRRLYL